MENIAQTDRIGGKTTKHTSTQSRCGSVMQRKQRVFSAEFAPSNRIIVGYVYDEWAR